MQQSDQIICCTLFMSWASSDSIIRERLMRGELISEIMIILGAVCLLVLFGLLIWDEWRRKK